MAAPKGEQEINKLFDEVINEISENGKSLISALKGRMSASTFYLLLKDEQKSQTYARACEDRAELMADEILSISDSGTADVNRDRLRVDSRKWLLAKLQPKKYGDKIDVEHSGNIILRFDADDEKL